jgi:DNA polymerase-3 subunit epsilon
MPTADTLWRNADLCAIDLELTGLKEDDEIIAFATVPITAGRAQLAQARYRLVKPNRMPGAETVVVHGLDSDRLAGAPPLAAVLEDLIDAITGRALVAHVAAIERRFLAQALAQVGAELRNPVIDTEELAATLFDHHDRPRERLIALTDLAGDLDLPVHRPHEADGDALTTAQVFLALASRLDAIEPQTIGSLQQPGARPGRWGRLRDTISNLFPG